jgi:hypothetical protein
MNSNQDGDIFKYFIWELKHNYYLVNDKWSIFLLDSLQSILGINFVFGSSKSYSKYLAMVEYETPYVFILEMFLFCLI